jgi:hypothetical protein
MNHSSPAFAERLRVALGLGRAETPLAGSERHARPQSTIQSTIQGTTLERGQVFADRLRRALGRD